MAETDAPIGSELRTGGGLTFLHVEGFSRSGLCSGEQLLAFSPSFAPPHLLYGIVQRRGRGAKKITAARVDVHPSGSVTAAERIPAGSALSGDLAWPL